MATVTGDNVLRRVWFAPYAFGRGPRFVLTVWDAYRRTYGKDALGYRLEQVNPDGTRATVFEGEDFGNAPSHSIDSDETVKGIMGFLTLRPGDTDADYFADYTPEQTEFAEQHAEALGCEVEGRFGDDR